MRSLLTPVALAAALSCAASAIASQSGPRAIDNVAAFARLYGVVRYFYPSDAAAALDWNRFAVHGVSVVSPAVDGPALERALVDLFGPLGPGIVIAATLPPPPPRGAAGDGLVAWRYFGPGGLAAFGSGPYRAKRTNRRMAAGAGIDGFITLMQSMPAAALRGRAIRLRGQVRAQASDLAGWAALWLRVDRPDQAMGFFDNMENRPIREPAWREYSIEGTVAKDAVAVAFGAMATGAVVADFDRLELSVRDERGSWAPIEIADSGFEAAADGQQPGWFRSGTSRTAGIARPSGEAPEGQRFLRFTPAVSDTAATAELFEDAPPVEGAHVDVDLGSGLRARVPLALPEAAARPDPGRGDRLEALRSTVERVREAEPVLDVRLADVVVAWNVFRHFYPYWTETAVDWDARLRPQLQDAHGANGRDAHHQALRRLVADARDGHGAVIEGRNAADRAMLPIRLASIEGRIVIAASDAAEAAAGAVVSAIDGVPAATRLADAMALTSGTTQWKQSRALQEIATCRKGSVVTLSVDAGGGARDVSLSCAAIRLPAERRPVPIAELSPGIWYVDLTRANLAQVQPMIGRLARATGVVFDVRGYPTDAGARILPHLMEAPEQDRWMHVAKLVGPFGQAAGWQSVGWNLKPVSPRLAGRIVFMTDGGAISYAESVMGYVGDRRLGTIVGSPTAGTNGNVAVFDVPGGFRIAFTGMKVTRHDGRSAHHLVGVRPDVPVEPTLASLRAGRDAVLERAVEAARGQ